MKPIKRIKASDHRYLPETFTFVVLNTGTTILMKKSYVEEGEWANYTTQKVLIHHNWEVFGDYRESVQTFAFDTDGTVSSPEEYTPGVWDFYYHWCWYSAMMELRKIVKEAKRAART